MTNLSSEAIPPPLPYTCGVSLRHLVELCENYKIEENDFTALCGLVKTLTAETKTSLAEALYANPETRKYVKPMADGFVSYAWKYPTMKTFKMLLKQAPNGGDLFLWLDCVVVNQHMAALGETTFTEWANTFGNNLKKIAKAYIILIPALGPVYATRSWCVFELYIIHVNSIAHDILVADADEEEFKNKVFTKAITWEEFRTIFSRLNVANAIAFNPEDKRKIDVLLYEVGVTKVNDNLMIPLKSEVIRMFSSFKTLATTVEDKINVLLSLAAFYRATGQFEEMRVITREAFAFAKEHAVGGIMMAWVLLSMSNNVLWFEKNDSSNEQRSLQMMDEAIEIFSAQKDEAGTAYALYLKGIRLNAQNNFDSALVALQTSLQIQTRLGLKREMAKTMLEMGATHQAQGHANLALKMFQDTLDIQLAVLEKDHIDLANTMGNLANMFEENDDLTRAREFHDKALEIKKRNLGADHQNVAYSLYNLSLLAEKQSQYAEALVLAEEALEIWQNKYGSNDQDARDARLLVKRIRSRINPSWCGACVVC